MSYDYLATPDGGFVGLDNALCKIAAIYQRAEGLVPESTQALAELADADDLMGKLGNIGASVRNLVDIIEELGQAVESGDVNEGDLPEGVTLWDLQHVSLMTIENQATSYRDIAGACLASCPG